MKGVPIGGFLSNIAASCVLIQAEAAWADSFPEKAQRFGLAAGQRRSASVAVLRYIDDVMFISVVLCRACLQSFLSSIYPVPFEVSGGVRVLQWLDLIFDLDTMKHGFYYRRPFATPPARASSVRQMRSYILGRIARLRALELEQQQVVVYVTRLCGDLCQCGWERKHFRALFYTLQGKPYSIEFFILCQVILTIR